MEIGSEFSYVNLPNNSNSKFEYFSGSDIKFLMCGRGCIDLIIKDILYSQSISKAYLPNYCCQSMIEPFEANGIECIFYDINRIDDCLKSTLDSNEKIDIFLRMGNYFGFGDDLYDENQIIELKKNQCLIVEDCTHSIFALKHHETSNYYFASLRKWLPIACGAICSKKDGKFNVSKNLSNIDDYMLKLKYKAMYEKSIYLNNEFSIEKEHFLSKFKIFNSYISRNYELTLIDDESLHRISLMDYAFIKERRRENASFLINEIAKIDKKILIYKKLDVNDVPLFVPIMVLEREKLQNTLRQNKIYCPSHWNKPQKLLANELYEQEISLVCDQRYSISDMKKIVECIKGWKKSKKMEEL